jgi:PAS domain S-box-containing protein
MARPLRILLIEHGEDVARVLLDELRRGGYAPMSERVETEPALRAALAQQWDVITSNYVLPQFSAAAALQLLQAQRVDVPVIIVSGEVGEEIAVTAMKAGAHDYVSTHKLARLVPAVERELREAEERRARRRAEEAFRASERRYHDIVETSHDWMWTADLNGTLTFSNQALTHVLGYTPDACLGRPLTDLVTPRYAAAVRAFLKSVHASSAQLEGEFVMLCKERKPVQLSIRATALRDEHGGVIGSMGTARDITKRKEAEEALRRSQADLQAILNNSLQSFILTDTTGSIKAFNQIASVRVEILFGLRPLSEGASIYNAVPVAHRPAFERDFARARDGEVVVREGAVGDQRGAEHWFEYNYIPVREGGDTVTGICISVLDITDRKQAETALLQTQRRLQSFIDQATDLIFTLDSAGCITSVNDSVRAVTGYTAEELVGRSALQLVAPHNLDTARVTLRAILGGHAVDQAEIEIVSKDGRRVWLEIRGHSVREGEQLVETFHIARDITKRKSAEVEDESALC